jgi:hypothetical protein
LALTVSLTSFGFGRVVVVVDLVVVVVRRVVPDVTVDELRLVVEDASGPVLGGAPLTPEFPVIVLPAPTVVVVLESAISSSELVVAAAAPPRAAARFLLQPASIRLGSTTRRISAVIVRLV